MKLVLYSQLHENASFFFSFHKQELHVGFTTWWRTPVVMTSCPHCLPRSYLFPDPSDQTAGPLVYFTIQSGPSMDRTCFGLFR